MKHTSNESGFTAVELLVTLFVAAIFLTLGYQIYTSTVKDSGETRALAKANNIAYNYLQQYKAKVSPTCASQTPLINQPIEVEGLTKVTVSVAISCPYSPSTTSVSKVLVTVKYNTPQKEVHNATYVKK